MERFEIEMIRRIESYGPDKMEPSEIIDPWEDYEEEDE